MENEKRTTKIVESPEKTYVYGNENGVAWVNVVDTYSTDINSSFLETYNINTTKYQIDLTVVEALKDNKAQLQNYLNVCEGLYTHSPISVEALNYTPQIYYLYDDLPKSFEDEKDEHARKRKQLELYKIAKAMVDLFKGIKNKVILKMGLLKQAYYNIQKLLYKSSDSTLALNSGTESKKKDYIDSLKVETESVAKTTSKEEKEPTTNPREAKNRDTTDMTK